MEVVGNGFTVIAFVAVFVQLFALVAINEQVVDVVGATIILVVVRFPGIQLYVVPPDAVNVTLAPLHSVAEGLTEILGVGMELTEM